MCFSFVRRVSAWGDMSHLFQLGETCVSPFSIPGSNTGCITSVRMLIGSTESSEVKVGLHQGSALSPLLFITVMDVISDEIGRGPPHAMLFADDLVICKNTHEQTEDQLELWRNPIENKGLRVSRSKTEYLPPSSCHDSKVKLGGEEIKNVTTFKYLGSMFGTEGGSITDCKNRVRLAWNNGEK